MGRWSFGLRQLFLWTSVIALGLVALRSASETWVSVLMGIAVAALASSILLAVYRRGPVRAYWVGFAAFGWLYLLVLAVSWTIAGSTLSPLSAYNLPTQKLAYRSYHWLYDDAFAEYLDKNASGNPYAPISGDGYVGSMGGSVPMLPGMPSGPAGPPPPTARPPFPDEADFINVAHSLWTLLFAAIGGSLAYWLFVTGPGRTERQASGSS
jgi:hypothetical protein